MFRYQSVIILKKSLLLATGANYRQKVLIGLIIDLFSLASLALTYKNDEKTKISGEVRYVVG
jgi:hypothetical protein